MVREWSRDHLPRHQWHQERFPVEPPSDDGRYHEISQDIRRPPLNIEKAFREHCNIPARHYFVAAILDDGTTQTFSGPGRHHPAAMNKFFSMDGFVRHFKTDSAGNMHEDADFGLDGEPYRQSYGSEYGRRISDRRRAGPEGLDDDSSYKTRKRPRGYHGRRPIHDDDEIPMGVTPRRGIKIGNSQEVWDFYEQRFKNCQQTACKLIAKAWVKVVEPKKQSTHPYTGMDQKKPDWWPQPWGKTKEEMVRHKEPDHLYKRERVHLLGHILRMIVEPIEKQHPSIQKMNLNVQKLEEATTEALSAFFADKENLGNARKKPYLNEIFKVAKFEERYKNGEIDGDTAVFVMAEDKFPENYMSDNEEGGPAKLDEDPHSMSSSVSPSKAAGHHDIMHLSATDPNSASALQGGPFMSELPVRGSQYSTQILPSTLHAESHFVESGGLHAPGALPMQDLVPNPHDTNRRPSIYATATEYSNPTPTAIYPQQWQPVSTGPGTGPLYAFTQQPPPPQAHYANHQSLPLAQGQYLPAQYEGLARGTFDQGPIFRSVNTTHSPVTNSQAFPNYLSANNRNISGPNIKGEALGRGQLS